MTQALEVRALDIIDEWLRTGQVSPTQESIKTRIQMASNIGEIDNGQRLVMVSIVPQLVSVALKLRLADQYSLIHKAEVDSNDLDIAEENLNRLYESLMKSEDESMILIHKMLYDLIDKLRIDQQKSQKGEQLDYSHENGAEDGGVKIDNKQTPSEMTQGSGGGDSHVN